MVNLCMQPHMHFIAASFLRRAYLGCGYWCSCILRRATVERHRLGLATALACSGCNAFGGSGCSARERNRSIDNPGASSGSIDASTGTTSSVGSSTGMEYTTVTRSGGSVRDSVIGDRTDISFYEPMGPQEVSRITAAPTPPPPCDDLPSYPSVPFLLHPHLPLLLWCSSSAVHAYDFVNHRWEAGGPQQLQPHLQELHHLPIAAADCICLDCGARSSALRDSSRLNKSHTSMRRFLSHNDSCPYYKDAPAHPDSPVACPPGNAGAELEGGGAGDAASSDDAGSSEAATAAIASDGAAGASNDHGAAFVPPAAASAAGRTSTGSVWVTAGEDKYLHFVEVGSYKLLRSRLQRKKLSSTVFLSSCTRAPVATSCPHAREHLTDGASRDSRLQQQNEGASATWCSCSLMQEQKQRPAVQLLVADKFGDVYLLRDCLGAPAEQSLAGDLLSERMRALPSLHGVRMSAESAAGARLLNAASSDSLGTLAATRMSAGTPDGAGTVPSAVSERTAAGESAAVVVNCSAAPARSAGAQLRAAHSADGPQTPNSFVEVMQPSGAVVAEASRGGVSGQETDSGNLVTPGGGGLAPAGDETAAASAVPASAQQEGAPAKRANEGKNLRASVAPRAEGDCISNPLLGGPVEEQGEIGQREGHVGEGTDAASVGNRAVKHVLRSETVNSLRPAATATADATCDAASAKAFAAVTRRCTPDASTDAVVADVKDAEQLHATVLQRGAGGCRTNESNTGEQGISSQLRSHQKPKRQQEPHEGQQQVRQQTQLLQQQTRQQKWALEQQAEEEEGQGNTRKQRFWNNAWQRERARLWRQQHLSTTMTRTQQQHQGDVDWCMTVGGGPHHQTEEDGEEDSVANDFADIPLLSHLTTITVMKVFPGSCILPGTLKDATAGGAAAQSETDAVAAPEHAGYSARLQAAAGGREGLAASPTNMASAVSTGSRISGALCSSRWGASPRRLHASVRKTSSEGGATFVSQLHLGNSEGCGAELLLTADRDEKVRTCLLAQPWSIESFYLGHSEFVADCLLIADGCVYDQREDTTSCGGCNSSSTREGLARTEGMSGHRTGQACQSTSNHSSVQVRTNDHGNGSPSENVGTACLLESSVGEQHQLRQSVLLGKLGISAAADGTLQVWRVSDGARVDELLLIPDALFDNYCSDLSRVLSYYEEAPTAVPPTAVLSSNVASRVVINREGDDLCLESVEQQHPASPIPPPLLSAVRLLPSSLLFDEDQRVLIVQCLKLRGLLLIPVGQRDAILPAALLVPPRSPLLSRHPFFIPFPAVPAAVHLVYHSLEELKQMPALAQAARVLRPLLAASTELHTEERRSSEHSPCRPCSISAAEWTSSDTRRLEEQCPPLISRDHVENQRLSKIPGAIPFVWWVDDMGRLRPPVCVSILVLEREQHRQLQQERQRAGASSPGALLRTPSSRQILPCVEGCSHDALGTDYGTSELKWRLL